MGNQYAGCKQREGQSEQIKKKKKQPERLKTDRTGRK